jgi:hypothetical protein
MEIKYDNPFSRFGRLTTLIYFSDKKHVEEFIKMGVRDRILDKIKDDLKSITNYRDENSETKELMKKLTVKLTFDLDKE